MALRAQSCPRVGIIVSCTVVNESHNHRNFLWKRNSHCGEADANVAVYSAGERTRLGSVASGSGDTVSAGAKDNAVCSKVIDVLKKLPGKNENRNQDPDGSGKSELYRCE